MSFKERLKNTNNTIVSDETRHVWVVQYNNNTLLGFASFASFCPFFIKIVQSPINKIFDC